MTRSDLPFAVWTYLNLIFNTILLPILVATFLLSKRVARHTSLITLCMTWIFSGVFSNLLYYSDARGNPSMGLCIAQASFMAGIPPMWSMSVLMLFYYMTMSCSGHSTDVGIVKSMMVLTAPYIAQLIFTLTTLIARIFVALENLQLAGLEQPTGLYCRVDNRGLSLAISLFTLVACLFIMKFKINLALVVYRNWKSSKRLNTINGVDAQFYTRVMAFGVFVSLGILGNLVSIFDPKNMLSDIFLAVAGTIVFLAFGTQSDVIHIWLAWLRVPAILRKHSPAPAGQDSLVKVPLHDPREDSESRDASQARV